MYYIRIPMTNSPRFMYILDPGNGNPWVLTEYRNLAATYDTINNALEATKIAKHMLCMSNEPVDLTRAEIVEVIMTDKVLSKNISLIDM